MAERPFRFIQAGDFHLERPLYGNAAPQPIGSRAAQLALPTWLNDRAWTIFGGSDEVQKTIIAKQVLGL